MNRQCAPDLNAIRETGRHKVVENIFINDTITALGKVQTTSWLNRKTQISNPKQTLITETLNTKRDNPEQSPFWSLVFMIWILFGIWCLNIGALVMENHKSQKSNLKQNSITEISNSKHNNSDQSLFKTLEFKYE